MRRTLLFAAIAGAILAACAPVLDRSLMKEGAREFDPRHLIETPEVFKGKLFIFGGMIVETRLTDEGSQMEALLLPVDSYGYLRSGSRYQGRFLALYPRSKGMLDPMIYKKGREVSLAAEYVGVRKQKLDEMEVSYPVFEVLQVHLWEEYRDYPYYAYPWPGYYPYYYPAPYPYDPWWRPYPGPHWPPPW